MLSCSILLTLRDFQHVSCICREEEYGGLESPKTHVQTDKTWSKLKQHYVEICVLCVIFFFLFDSIFFMLFT